MSIKRDMNIPLLWVCVDCGKKARATSAHGAMTFTSTFHAGICDCCSQRKAVCPVGDFGYPSFDKVQV